MCLLQAVHYVSLNERIRGGNGKEKSRLREVRFGRYTTHVFYEDIRNSWPGFEDWEDIVLKPSPIYQCKHNDSLGEERRGSKREEKSYEPHGTSSCGSTPSRFFFSAFKPCANNKKRGKGLSISLILSLNLSFSVIP